MKKAIYAFSGDPITLGHIDIIKRATRVFDQIIVGIGVNPNKKYTFTLDERTDMARRSLANIPNVKVISFDGLLVDYAFENGIPVILKGVRNSRDFDYEVMLHHLSESQKLDIDTYLLPAKQDLTHISSSAAKALQQENGLIHEYVPLYVKMCLEARISGQYIVGITGEIGVGKSFVSSKLKQIGKKRRIPVHHIELDHIGHQILGKLPEPLYKDVRREIMNKFGEHVGRSDGSINRKELGKIVFNNSEKLMELNKLLYRPLLVRLRRELYMKKGVMLLNAALIAESNMSYLTNNNTILVKTNKNSQIRRLKERKLKQKQIQKRIESQFNTKQKKEQLKSQIEKGSFGKMWVLDNSDDSDEKKLDELFNNIVTEIDVYGELRFMSLWDRLGIKEPYLKEYTNLINRYSENHRYYHTLKHIVDGLNEYQKVKDKCKNPNLVEFAWWYHDAIYKTKSKENERKSAELAHSVLKRIEMDTIYSEDVKKYIFWTQHNNDPKDTDARILIDIDISIFGKSEEEYNEYERNIRKEYHMISDIIYKKKRCIFLQDILNKETIYHTTYFRSKYETIARDNIMRTIKMLR